MSKSKNKGALVSCEIYLEQEIEIMRMFPLIKYHSHITMVHGQPFRADESFKRIPRSTTMTTEW